MSSRKSPPSSSPPRGSPSGSPSLVSHSQHHGIPGLAAVTGQAQTNGLPCTFHFLSVFLRFVFARFFSIFHFFILKP
jgi:hypothetical protein